MSKYMEVAVIIKQQKLAKDIYDMRLYCPDVSLNAKPGQFVLVYLHDKTKLLPRPISICEIDKKDKSIRLVYRVTGEHTGTKQMSLMKAETKLNIMGPLGKGFPLDAKETVLIGGGIGIPPLLETLKNLEGLKTVLLGYRDSDTFLFEEFKKYAKVHVATEDGSIGVRGNVMDIIRQKHVEPKLILACGPNPMLRAIKSYAEEGKIKAYLSMEERMACGIGACLACVCKSKEIDNYSYTHSKRVCKDGPVFDSREIVL